MYYFPEPPYFLMIASFLASIASGAAFSATLKIMVQQLKLTDTGGELTPQQRTQLLTPFLGIAIGSCVFLGSGTEVFGFPRTLAYEIAIPMTLLIGSLVWTQLIKNIKLLLTEGSQAFDLDSFF